MSTNYLSTSMVPPFSMEAEQAALGAMLLSKDALDVGLGELKTDSFYRIPHQSLFEVLLEMNTKQVAIDLATATDYARTSGKLDTIGGAVYITQLLDSPITTTHIEQYIATIKTKKTLRDMLVAAQQIAKLAHTQTDSVAALAEAEALLYVVGEQHVQCNIVPIKEVIQSLSDELEKRSAADTPTGISAGFPSLDDAQVRLQPGNMITVAGRPSAGKTAYALNVATIAADLKVPVGLISLEMTKEELVARIMCAKSGVPSTELLHGIIGNSDWKKVVDASGRMYAMPIVISDPSWMNDRELRYVARRMKRQHNIELLIIDYLQLLHVADRRGLSRQQEVSELSRLIKAIAKELKIPVMVLSQLNREVEDRNPPIPVLSDLRESGCIEQDSDIVMMIWRPDYYNPSDRPGKAQVLIEKYRNGPTGNVWLDFNKPRASFEEPKIILGGFEDA